MDLAGKQLSHYRVDSFLGAGAMGEVYLATDVRLERRVALKVIHPEIMTREDIEQRFILEAKAAARVTHTNIAQIYDIGSAEEGGNTLHFIAMEYVEGGNLADLIKEEGPLSSTKIFDVARQAAAALEAIHQSGIYHRDIKSANLMITTDGTVKIMDFGLAKLAHGSVHLSREGAVIGTLSYISPEQIQGKSVDGRSELYSLGIVLFECATGRLPFQGDDPATVMFKHITSEVPIPSSFNPELSARLEAVILKLLSKHPEDRYERAGAMVEELESFKESTFSTFDDSGVRFDFAGDLMAQRDLSEIPVGMDREIELLKEKFFDCSTQQRGQMIFIQGAPGMGKSRLVNELLLHINAQGIEFCHVRIDPREDAPVLHQMLCGLVGDGDVLHTTRELLRNMARYAPRLQEYSENPEKPVPKKELSILENAVLYMVINLSETTPLIVEMSEAHLLAPHDVGLLYNFIKNTRTRQVMVLAKHEPPGKGDNPHFWARRALMKEEYVSFNIFLNPLTLMDVQTLLDYQFQGSHLPMSLAIRIHEESQGSPEYIHDIISGLKEEEIIVEAGGLWKLDADQFELPAPRSSREYFGPMVERIPEADLGVLQLASVIGREFDIEEIARFLSVNKVELFQRLRRAVSRTELLWLEGRRIGFVHAQARKLIHETIPRETRQVYHQQYAEYLFDAHRDRLAGISDVLSYHYLESGNRKKAISLFVNLGEQAAEEENYATARRYFEEALAQFNSEKVPREIAEKQSWIFFKLGEVDYGEGSFDSALSRYRKAVDLANRLKDVRLLSRAQEAVWRCEEKLGIRKN